MWVQKNFNLRQIIAFGGGHMLWLLAWSAIVVLVHEFADIGWLSIPWLPLSVIGTAVAFYIGFKNNSSYDRMWEARKIWGAIVNSSRAWGSTARAFISNQFAENAYTEAELQEVIQRMIHRHIAWLYALRSQLLIPTQWEHSSQSGLVGRKANYYRKNFGVGLIDDDVTKAELKAYLPEAEFEPLINFRNTATQIIDRQAQELKQLREIGLIEDFRHMEMQNILNDFYVHQGKCERIKKFPLPRQYGGMSVVFIGIFIFLLPFGMVSEFAKLGEFGAWLSIPFTALVAWVYLMMELVGDYSENPFQGLGNDIPMQSLCRTIEIDLLEMLGEKDLPDPIEPKNNILL